MSSNCAVLVLKYASLNEHKFIVAQFIVVASGAERRGFKCAPLGLPDKYIEPCIAEVLPEKLYLNVGTLRFPLTKFCASVPGHCGRSD